MKLLITGGAGFIGSAVIRFVMASTDSTILNIDALTYAGNLESLPDIATSARYQFSNSNICDRQTLRALFEQFQPDTVLHLAAESHVDRSIDNPDIFLQTNIMGTFELLNAATEYWQQLIPTEQSNFRFVHVSTDEVYGDLSATSPPFSETTPYAPSSPYSASKASADHLARAWYRTYGLPTIVTNCSNNYGPFQFPEKLIPHMILSALENKPLPLYGNGLQIRDWLYVEDHAKALWKVSCCGVPGETYNIGGHNEMPNIEVVQAVCRHMDERLSPAESFNKQIKFVTDRPGHDTRYAIDAAKIERELQWTPVETFDTGIAKTVDWYLERRDWWADILNGNYQLNRIGK